MYIVYGRGRGDSYSRYTYYTDYFITDLNPECLRAFTISPLTALSDHNKIRVMNRVMLNHEASKPEELYNIKTCCRWKEDSVEIYQKTIRQQQIQYLLDNFLDKKIHCNREGINLSVENLNSISTAQLPYQI
jgi:hypothetical protein